MIEPLIIIIIVSIAVSYIFKTFKNIFFNGRKNCESCDYRKCPYTNLSECPAKTSYKMKEYLLTIPQNDLRKIQR